MGGSTDDAEVGRPTPTLRPRDIQARIRAGRSVEDVAAASGMPEDRVRRFAAPVLAEREYVAGQAMAALVRRHGETSGHRKLRIAVGERLFAARVDADEVDWDAARLDDGRWAVTARYRLPGDAEPTEAVFVYDQPGRFSVAGNAQARWLLGETDDPEGEPTLRLDGDDELAIVRSVKRTPRTPGTSAQVRPLRPDTPEPDQDDATADQSAAAEPEPAAPLREPEPTLPDPEPQVDAAAPAQPEPVPDEDEHTGGLDVLYDILDRSGTEFTEDSVPIVPEPAVPQPAPPAPDVPDPRFSDAAAVPETAVSLPGDDPMVEATPFRDYPVEPSLFDDVAELAGPPAAPQPAAPQPAAPPAEPAPAAQEPPAQTADKTEVETAVEAQAEVEAQADVEAAESDRPAPKKKGSRKRATVPSWDEIMFGSPRPKP